MNRFGKTPGKPHRLAIGRWRLQRLNRGVSVADLFISYKRENLAAVQPLVQGLRGAGLDVWWDQDIAPDAPWEATIERELEAAKVVIVAWSEAAAASENVKAEARRARGKGKLIQVFVEPSDPPLFFGERQGVDLTGWNGSANDGRFKTVLAAARAIIAGKKPPHGVGYAPKKRAPWATLTAVFVFVGALLGFVANLGSARDAACSINALNQICLQWGLIEPEAPVETVEARQQRIIQTIAGTWGRLDRDCAETVTYSIEQDAAGTRRIRGVAPGFEGVMQVIAIDPATGAITARNAAPNDAGVRELWELRVDGDVLALRDQAGTETAFGRCAP